MRYIIADTETASRFGFAGPGYPTNNGLTCINEKDILSSPMLEGNLQQRDEAIGGRIVTRGEALEAMGGKTKSEEQQPNDK